MGTLEDTLVFLSSYERKQDLSKLQVFLLKDGCESDSELGATCIILKLQAHFFKGGGRCLREL